MPSQRIKNLSRQFFGRARCGRAFNKHPVFTVWILQGNKSVILETSEAFRFTRSLNTSLNIIGLNIESVVDRGVFVQRQRTVGGFFRQSARSLFSNV